MINLNPQTLESSNPLLNSRILLTLLKEDPFSPLEERIKAFLDNGEIDWKGLLEDATYHGIAPIIYQNLKEANLKSIPDYFLENLKAIYYGNVRRNTRYFAELERVLKLLKETGVEPIVLKGGAMAEEVYKNIALRPLEDIDLLVKKFDLPAAKAVFERWGYASQKKIFQSKAHKEFEEEIRKPFEKFETELHFIKGEREYFFDVHWNLLIICDSKIKEAIQLDMERIWKRKKLYSFGTSPAYLMSPEDLLIYVCLHLRERHLEKARSRLIWWYDIYKIIKTYENGFDWNYFLASVREYEACESIYPLILTLKEWFNPPLPQDLLKEAQSYLEIFPLEKIVPKSTEQLKFIGKHQEKDYLLEVLNVKGLRKKVKLLLSEIFPKKEYMILKYQIKNQILLPFYYLLRLKNAIIRGFKAAGQMLKL